MTVLQFIDEHPTMSQQAIVKHFKTQVEGALMSDDEAEEEREKELMMKQVIELCQQMEALCIEHGSFGDSLGLAKHLRQY